MSLLGKPEGVCASAAADIDNDLSSLLKVSRDEAFGPHVFERTNAITQPTFLVECFRVVPNYIVRHVGISNWP